MSRHLILPATVVAATMALQCTAVTPTPPMTEAQAIAERDRLQKIHSYFGPLWDKQLQKHIDKTISGAANWTAAGCADPAFNGCATTWSICCEGESTGSAPWNKRSKCEDVEGYDGCAFNCADPTHTNYAAECTTAGYEGASVCGTDSAGNEVPAWPMVRPECSTGPTHELDGYWEEKITNTDGSEDEIKHPTPVSSFYDDVNNNTQVPDGVEASTVLGKWSKNVLGFAILTNAANATSRATVTIEPHSELVIAYKSRNNAKMVVNGSYKTHFIAIDPTNYGNGAASGDGMSILGGDTVVLGATSMGSLNSTTNGSSRMHNIVNSGNVISRGSTDMFMSNVQSSGDVTAEATSSTDKRVLYNVTATAGKITVIGGLSAIYSVNAHAACVMSVTGGTHFISNTTNAGSLSVNSCAYVNMYNVINTGTVTASCTTVYGRKMENNGGTVTFTAGDLDLEIVANTGTVDVSTGVTGVITAPIGTTLNVPSTVTVTWVGTTVASTTVAAGTTVAASSTATSSTTAEFVSGSVSGASAGTFFAAAFVAAAFAMML